MHTETTRRPNTTTQSRNTMTEGEREVHLGLAALRPAMYGRALRLCRCPSRADDVVQEAMLRALRFAGQYHAGTNLKAWVGQVLMSVFLTQCRRKKRERRALDGLTTDPCAWLKKDAATMMTSLSQRPARALASLPDSYRTAVQLVDIQDLSYRDAADRLGVPVGTIMSRLHRGRKLLAAQLTEQPAAMAA
jgi:RNA polymerase sigma-70 factor (ECF subfamily)